VTKALSKHGIAANKMSWDTALLSDGVKQPFSQPLSAYPKRQRLYPFTMEQTTLSQLIPMVTLGLGASTISAQLALVLELELELATARPLYYRRKFPHWLERR
jgi:hypothetical protein